MTQIGVDEKLFNLLKRLSEPLELVDGRGRVLAQVLPVDNGAPTQPWDLVFDKEELRRQRQSEKWYTTAEVLEHLRNLGAK